MKMAGAVSNAALALVALTLATAAAGLASSQASFNYTAYDVVATGNDATCVLYTVPPSNTPRIKCWGYGIGGDLGVSSTQVKAEVETEPLEGQFQYFYLGQSPLSLGDNLPVLSFTFHTSQPKFGSSTLGTALLDGNNTWIWGSLTGFCTTAYSAVPAPWNWDALPTLISQSSLLDLATGEYLANVAVGFGFCAGISTSNRLYTWGFDGMNGVALGALADGIAKSQGHFVRYPQPIMPSTNFSSVCATMSGIVALAADGTVSVAGAQSQYLNLTASSSPAVYNLTQRTWGSGASLASSIACGAFSFCAVDAQDGSVWCAGTVAVSEARVGVFTTPDLTQVLSVPQNAGAAILQLSVGQFHACALAVNGTTFCWGARDAFLPHVQAEEGSYTSLLDTMILLGPTQVTFGATNASTLKVMSGLDVNFAILSDGTLRGVGITSLLSSRSQLGAGPNAYMPEYQVMEIVGKATGSPTTAPSKSPSQAPTPPTPATQSPTSQSPTSQSPTNFPTSQSPSIAPSVALSTTHNRFLGCVQDDSTSPTMPVVLLNESTSGPDLTFATRCVTAGVLSGFSFVGLQTNENDTDPIARRLCFATTNVTSAAALGLSQSCENMYSLTYNTMVSSGAAASSAQPSLAATSVYFVADFITLSFVERSYLGCFVPGSSTSAKFTTFVSVGDGNASPTVCATHAPSTSTVFGVNGNNTCAYGSISAVTNMQPISSGAFSPVLDGCLQPCSGGDGSTLCGGLEGEAYSTYLLHKDSYAASTWVGCFRDGDASLSPYTTSRRFPLEMDSTNLTVELCRSYVQSMGTTQFSYFAVQDGNQCFYGEDLRLDNIEAYGSVDRCLSPCGGDSSEMCGGYGTNAVYKTFVPTSSPTRTPSRTPTQAPAPTQTPTSQARSPTLPTQSPTSKSPTAHSSTKPTHSPSRFCLVLALLWHSCLFVGLR